MTAENNREDPRGRAVLDHLVAVHDMYRRELARLRDEMTRITNGSDGAENLTDAARAFSDRHKRDLRVHCLQFCDAVTAHHTVEDTQMFPQLRGYSATATPVIDRLRAEHGKIGDLLARLESTARDLTGNAAGGGAAAEALTRLADQLEAHLDNEENSLAVLFGLRTR